MKQAASRRSNRRLHTTSNGYRRKKDYAVQSILLKKHKATRRRPQARVSHIIGVIAALFVIFLLYTVFIDAPRTAAESATREVTDREPVPMLAGIGAASEIGISSSVEAHETMSAGNGGNEQPAGSGILQVDREQDYDHIVASGETLSEIAYIYQIDTQQLAAYNQIGNIHEIRIGDVIHIPSIAKEKQLAQRESIAKVRTTTNVPAERIGALPDLVIAAQDQYDGHAVTAHFVIQAPKDIQLNSLEWDLGNGRKSFRPETFWTYDNPGTYRVSLTAKLPDRRVLKSNEIIIDVPHPTTYQTEYQSFTTLSSVDEQIALQGELISILNYRSLETAPIRKISSSFDTTTYKFTRPGFYNLTIEDEGIRSNVYVFVSPLESIHVDRPELNWYRTQFDTGSLSNCGPTTVAMAIAWANGDYVPVSTIRQEVGWHEARLGATTLEELNRSLIKNDVNVRYRRLYSKYDLFNVIDSGNIAIVLFETGDIPDNKDTNPLQDLFSRYYTYTQGHYIVIKGYTTDKRYFIVYDPIPSDWGSNSLRHQDGISMIGRNRYYPADILVRSITKKRPDFLEIWR